VKLLLVDDGIDTNGSLPRLAVADHQLPLATANGDHRVDGLDTRLQGLIYRLAVNNARCFPFDRHLIGFAHDRPFAVNRLTQRVHHTPQHTLANLDRGNPAGTPDGITFLDLIGLSKQYHAHVILLKIQYNALQSVVEFDQFTGLDFR